MKNQSVFIKRMTALAMAILFLVSTSVMRVAAAPTPNLTPQQIEAVIEDAFAGLVAFDVPRVMNNFAADAVLEDPVGTPPMQGAPAITAYPGNVPDDLQSNEALLARHQGAWSGSRRQMAYPFYDPIRKCLLPRGHRLLQVESGRED